jgi:hypothetical protein
MLADASCIVGGIDLHAYINCDMQVLVFKRTDRG